MDAFDALQAMAERRRLSRRSLLNALGTGAALVGASMALAGCGGGSGRNDQFSNQPPGTTPIPPPPPPTITDADVLNFALNLEYLEAEYYLRGAFGTGLSTAESGGSTATVTGGRQVPFTNQSFAQYAQEIARDEQAHVNFLRTALGGAAVAKPALDFTNAFNAAAQAAGIVPAGGTFDPFSSETNFLLGAFVFEDVGVTAYAGAAPLLTSASVIDASAGILAVEAFHAAEIRTILYQLGSQTQTIAGQIAALRGSAGNGKDQGIVVNGQANIVPTDQNALAFARTTSEVLRIVYLTPSGSPSRGGFFPNGLNGTIKTAS